MDVEFGPPGHPRKYRLLENDGLYLNGRDLRLRPNALKVLAFLVRSAPRKIPNRAIADVCNGAGWQGDENRFAAEYIRQIRNVLGKGERTTAIRNDRSIGYCFGWNVLQHALEDSEPRQPLVVLEGDGRTQHVSVAKLPRVHPRLVGRNEQLQQLDEAWVDPGIRLVSVVASGGVGKTALVVNWWHRHTFPDASRILGWSFYSQGAAESRQESAEFFFDHAFREWFGDSEVPKDTWVRGVRLATLIREQRTLLILDGLEPLQFPRGETQGRLKDPGIVALLKELAAQNSGLCICTSRLPLTDLEDYSDFGVLELNLNNLSPDSGSEYLKLLGVEGPAKELAEASRNFGNHALALTLLGNLLFRRYGGDVRKRDTIPSLFTDTKQGGHARRVLRSYETLFRNGPELTVLRMLGLFDRPTDAGAIRVLRTLQEDEWISALETLHDARLIDYKDVDGPLDCHPLVREHFGEIYRESDIQGFREAHSKLFDYYSEQAPAIPSSLMEMTPLFYAVYHGCLGGREQAACVDIYGVRIQRGDQYYLMRNLGAFGANLSVLACFFVAPWKTPLSTLSRAQQAEALSEAGFVLRALGRLSEAVEPMKEAAARHSAEGDKRETARQIGNLVELQLTLGQVLEAVTSARSSLGEAERSEHLFERLKQRTKLANALHQSGDLVQAARLFAEAESMQREWKPSFPYLFAYRGYQYRDLLVSMGQSDEAIRRAELTLAFEEENGVLLSIALCHLSLGHFDEAVSGLRLAGHIDDLPLGLLARGTQEDLLEVHELATRSGMRLHLADYHLKQAKYCLTQNLTGKALVHYTQAQTLVETTGYRRRDPELRELKQYFLDVA